MATAAPLDRALARSARTTSAYDVLSAILAADEIHPVYQPIVALDTGRTVAYEALARGPRGSSLERPDRLFAAARSGGLVAELDWACRGAALQGALDAGLRRPLFLNAEPDTLAHPCPDHLSSVRDRAARELDVVVEVTERALTDRPADLLHALEQMRGLGWGIAVDDVGADVRSLALMPLLRPDVIKLDLRLVQAQPDRETAEIVNAVNAQAERTGALVLAEGIETERHLETARALGATLGQGWLFARPGPLDGERATGRALSLPGAARGRPGLTPFDVVRRVRQTRHADKRLLISVSLFLERQARALGQSGVILSAFQSADRFTPLTASRYAGLAANAPLVAALGAGMGREPSPYVRGAQLAEDDPLREEWSVVVVGPHFAAALVAVDLGDDGPEMDRRFEFALTYDRELVIDAATSLMRRIEPID